MLTSTTEATCRECGRGFLRLRPLQAVCGYGCAKKTAQKARKQASRAIRARKEAIKTRSEWMKEAQIEFNRYIRCRDSEKPCVSCGRNHDGQWHAGHYLSTGARPELRFDEQNVHKQCQPCNCHLHGNLVAYRSELSIRIGEEALARLEGSQAPKKYGIDELRAIKATYRAKTKALQSQGWRDIPFDA